MTVSADGLVVAGDVTHTSGFHEAFRWTEVDGMIGLGDLLPSGVRYSAAWETSANGSVVVGFGTRSTYPATLYEAFRWTASGGMVGLGFLPSRLSSMAKSVSSDGSVVVGSSGAGALAEAFRWTAATGMVGLGDLPGDYMSVATDVSADGEVIVGYSATASSKQAFRWTEDAGMVALGYLPGGSYSEAHGVSADGSVVVGWGSAGQDVVGDVQNVIRLVVGQMDFQQMQPLVNRLDQPGSPGQQMYAADPARPQAARPVGQLVMNVAGRKHGFGLVAPVAIPEPILDSALAVDEFSGSTGVHSKCLRAYKGSVFGHTSYT
ncbi:MAG: hypothetical protein KAY37_00850 [Phycisphaerae bacterium]|nr:hypothetical protein [Phycisphaerae bacterium]